MAKGLNMQSVKNENRSLILYTLNACGALSRKELASRLGLTPAAVTKICADLIEKGFIKEGGEINENGRSGRREILLQLCLEDKVCMGIHAEKDTLTFSLSTLSGKLISERRIAFLPDVKDVLNNAAAFLADTGVDRNNVVGVGVCIIGSVDENDFGVWKEKNLKKRFEEALGLPVVIENNVKAFALGELLYGDIKNTSSVLFLKWGPGVGSAIVADGKVFSGNDSSVAEIGHYIVNPGGVKCRCGRYGCLETEVSEDKIIAEIGTQKTLDEIVKNCDNRIINILDHKIDMVALALANTATILSANNIVLFGAMFQNQLIAEKLIKQCIRYNSNLEKSMLHFSRLNEKMNYIGTSAICAKQFFFESED